MDIIKYKEKKYESVFYIPLVLWWDYLMLSARATITRTDENGTEQPQF